MKFLDSERRRRNADLRRSLATEDRRLVGAAALIDLDDGYDTGCREAAFTELAEACARFGLDAEPEVVAGILHELYPDLAGSFEGWEGAR